MNLRDRIIDCDQLSSEWFDLHVGRVTASGMKKVLAFYTQKGKLGAETKARADYKAMKVAEILTGRLIQSNYVSDDMEDGIDKEPFARAAYQMRTGYDVDQVGFVLHPTIERCGCSPDGLMLDICGGLEIKCPRASTHIKYLIGEEVPDEYEPQVALQIRCADLDWVDFVSYCPELPENLQLFVKRMHRNEDRMREIDEKVMQFLYEVDSLVTRLNTLFPPTDAPGSPRHSQLNAQLEESLRILDEDILRVESSWRV